MGANGSRPTPGNVNASKQTPEEAINDINNGLARFSDALKLITSNDKASLIQLVGNFQMSDVSRKKVIQILSELSENPDENLVAQSNKLVNETGMKAFGQYVNMSPELSQRIQTGLEPISKMHYKYKYFQYKYVQANIVMLSVIFEMQQLMSDIVNKVGIQTREKCDEDRKILEKFIELSATIARMADDEALSAQQVEELGATALARMQTNLDTINKTIQSVNDGKPTLAIVEAMMKGNDSLRQGIEGIIKQGKPSNSL